MGRRQREPRTRDHRNGGIGNGTVQLGRGHGAVMGEIVQIDGRVTGQFRQRPGRI